MTSFGINADCVTSVNDRIAGLLDQGNYQAALHELQHLAVALEGTGKALADNCVNQAVCLIHLDQPQAALDRCDRAIAAVSDHSQAWLFRGVALHRLGRFQEAYAAYRLAVGTPPTSRWPWRRWVRRCWAIAKTWLKRFFPHKIARPWVN